MSRTILLLLLVLSGPLMAEDAMVESLSQLELLNTLTKREMQLENQLLESRLAARLTEIEQQNAIIIAQQQQRNSDMGNYIDAISWISGIVIGFVGIIFGIGAFILYRENADVTAKANAQLEAWNEQTATLQETYNKWFNDAKREYMREIDLLGRIMRLRILLDQGTPTAEEIYPEISPLYSRPKLEYLPIFKKILSMNISPDIDRHTSKAIDQIMDSQREPE